MSMNRQMITFGRILKGGGQGFVRNASLSVAATAVMVITLTILLFSFIANTTFANTVKQLTDKIDISVYLKDTVTPEQRDKLLNDMRSQRNIASVEYLSKDQVLAKYKEDNKGNPDLLSAVSEADNRLPATIRLKPRDPNRIPEIKAFLDKPEVLELQSDKTSYSDDRKEAIDKITSATRFFREAGVVGIIIFMLVSVLIIFNTIRMTIFNRRDELQIMRLLGASTSYIRGPFIVETVLYGVLAAVLSVLFCSAIFQIASSTLQASTLGILDIRFSSDFFNRNFWLILTVQIAIGMLIGAVSSFIATRRYLKFKSSK